LDSGVLSHYVGTNTLHEFCGRYPNIPIVSSEVALKGISSVLLGFYQDIRKLIRHLIEAHGCRPAQSRSNNRWIASSSARIES
jgi:hypothetical protein